MVEKKLCIFKNKRNNQLTVVLNKKKLGIKGKDPKFLRIKEEDLIF